MTRWHALVPIKAAHERKVRLAVHLSPQERVALSDAMLWHVLGVLQASQCIGTVTLLSPRPIPGWDGARFADQGRGLNAELQLAAALLEEPLLVIHADLPTLIVEDIAAMTQAGGDGVALAPDRRHRGTNAIALKRPADFIFAFGENSLARHRTQRIATTIIDRPGLALDIDVLEDLALLAGHPASWLEGCGVRPR